MMFDHPPSQPGFLGFPSQADLSLGDVNEPRLVCDLWSAGDPESQAMANRLLEGAKRRSERIGRLASALKRNRDLQEYMERVFGAELGLTPVEAERPVVWTGDKANQPPGTVTEDEHFYRVPGREAPDPDFSDDV